MRLGAWISLSSAYLAAILLGPPAVLLAGEIRGTIGDAESRAPLAGANVEVLGTGLGTSAGNSGKFEILSLPPDRYDLRVTMMGYEARVIRDVVVAPTGPTRLTIWLRPTVLEFEPLVVSAAKLEQRLHDASASISVVTAEEIRQRNPVDLVQALELVPGVNFIGNQINVRGSTGFTFGAGNKVLLLLDGVPVQASDTGEFNWDMIPPSEVQQIEVVKGAGSALWGSSALGGVVNIITRAPDSQARIAFSYRAARYGHPPHEAWEWTDPGRLHYTREDVGYTRSIGRLGIRLSLGRMIDTGYRQLGDARKHAGTASVAYTFPNGTRWSAYAAYSRINRGFFVQWKGPNDPYEVDETQLNNRAALNQLNTYTKLHVPLSPRLGLSFRASVIRTVLGNRFGAPSDFNPAYGQGAEAQATWLPGDAHTLTGGLQFQLDGGNSEYFGRHKGYFLAGYFQDEWRWRPGVRVTAGARYDGYFLDDRSGEGLLSPRLGVNWQPWPITSLRASVGSGFRAATIVERFLEVDVMNFTVKSSPGLKSERSWAYDLGLRHYLTSDWVVDVSLFRNDYTELVEAHLDIIRGVIEFRNIPRAQVQGLEATTELTQRVNFLGQRIDASLRGSLTWLDHQELEFGDPLPYRPEAIGHVRGTLALGRLEAEADYRYASRIEAVKIYPINQRVPMRMWDVRLSCRLAGLTFRAETRNLLNYSYAPMESNLEPPRTFAVGVSGEF